MRKTSRIRGILILLLSIAVTQVHAGTPPAAAKRLLELRVYHFTTSGQEAILDRYFSRALLPALHKEGIKKVGFFKAIANDTAADKKFYVLLEYASFEQRAAISAKVSGGREYSNASVEYARTPFDKPAFTRMEVILMTPFSSMPAIAVPRLKNLRSERVYELRSYESATESSFQNKVAMFNKGGEVALFARLNFNAVFYGEVVAGPAMPNLMYMTSFENKADRDEHWKTFGSDPTWKALSGMKEYQNNVSKIHIDYLRATEYSDL